MAVRINGWIRLWAVLSMIGLVVTSVLAYVSLPSPETLAHQASFEDQLSAAARGQLASDGDVAIRVRMQNGHILSVKAAEIEARKPMSVVKEYESLLKAKANEQVPVHLARFGLGWLAASVAILLLGIAAAWVRHGFEGGRGAA